MRKYFWITVILACSVVFSVTLLSAQEGLSQEPEVEVIHLSGSPRVCRAGQTECTAIKEGMFLKAGDRIKTDVNESVELSFDEDNKNVVRVEGKTGIALILKDEKIELLEGRVFSIIEELPAQAVFEIRTPTAVAGVRGTDWLTSIEGEETVVEAVDGTPYVKGIDKSGKVLAASVNVLPGYLTRVRRFQMPGALKKIPIANRLRWQQVRSELKQRARNAILKRGPGYIPHPRPINLKKALPVKGGRLQDKSKKIDPDYITHPAVDNLRKALHRKGGRLQDKSKKEDKKDKDKKDKDKKVK